MFILRDFEYSSKTVFLRVDLNSPLREGKITNDARFRSIIPTINYLLEKGAKLVIGTHQGKPYGDEYSTTEEHAKILESLLNVEVKYVDDVIGPLARNTIKKLDEGEVVLLQNLRFVAEEVFNKPIEACEKSFIIKRLSPLVDIVVNDAFASAHRSHPSLVGFARVRPMVAGFLMQREINALSRAFETDEKPRVYVLGGSKVGDSLKVIENVLRRGRADVILTGGLVANIITLAKGFYIGDKNLEILENMDLLKYVEVAERLLDEFYPMIRTPVDFAVDVGGERVEVDLLTDNKKLLDDNPILDIGSRTVEKYSEIIKSASTVVANGPMGVFEREEFALGTVGVFKAIAKSKAFSVVGGGHSIASLEKYRINGINHISTGGGAMLAFFSGDNLPVLEALELSEKTFKGLNHNTFK